MSQRKRRLSDSPNNKTLDYSSIVHPPYESSDDEMCLSSPPHLSQGSTCLSSESETERRADSLDELEDSFDTRGFEPPTHDEDSQDVSETSLPSYHGPSDGLELHDDTLLDVSVAELKDTSLAVVKPDESFQDEQLTNANESLPYLADEDNISSLDDQFVKDEREYADSEFSLTDGSDNEHYFEDFQNPLIYDGANISVNDSMIAILSYAIRHKLSGKAIADLLKLISLHCKPDSKFKSSLFAFKKYFSNMKTPPVFHYFCSTCSCKLAGLNSKCSNTDKHPSSKEVNFFVELPLVSQIQSLFMNEEFCRHFNHRLKRTKSNEQYVEDIYDGQLYKELIDSGLLSDKNENNFSLLTFSDGVPVFKSSTHGSLWPLYFCINELPYEMRVSKQYMLIGGLWYGKKPCVNLMLEPFMTSLKLIRRGIKVKPYASVVEIIVKGILLCATFDLPAKAMFLGMSQYNGFWGCQICKEKGKSVKVSFSKKTPNTSQSNESNKKNRESRVFVYSFSKDVELRQLSETIKFGERAHEIAITTPSEDVNVFGVKYPSILFKLMYDAVRGVGIDELHAIYLGIATRLIVLWFDPKYRYEPYSLYKHLQVVDDRLKNICPPNFIHRRIRSIQEDFSHWKGSEKKVWLLYLSLPVLSGVMKQRYLDHHSELVHCLHILLSSSIHPQDILMCTSRLQKYVQDFETLYGTQNMLMNVHLIQHLPLVVNNLGPLWCYSCFPFENLNGEILQMIHGTRYIETQVASCVYLLSQLPHAVKSLKSTTVKEFCNKVLNPSCRLKKLEVIDDCTFAVGCFGKIEQRLETIAKTALESIGVTSKKLQYFFKLKTKKWLFVGKSYGKIKRNISYLVSFMRNDSIAYGILECFVKICCICSISCSCAPSYFAIIEGGTTEPHEIGQIEITFMKIFSLTSKYVAVPTHALKEILFYINLDNKSYIVSRPNVVQVE